MKNFKTHLAMKKFLIAAAVLASSSTTFAAGVYVGGSAGYTHANIDCTGTTSCSNNGTGLKGFVGYQINDMFAVEASYFDLGKPGASIGATNVDIKSTGYGMRGLLYFPIVRDLSGFAALGINRVKSEVTVTGSPNIDETTTKPSAAFGVDYALTPALKLRGEIESFRFDGPRNSGGYNVVNFSAGLKYSF